MVYKTQILPTAERELDGIVAYLSEFGLSTAVSFLEEYHHQLDLLSEGAIEYSFSRMPELAALGYHTALVNRYLFLYYVEGDMLKIAHFFHQSQNYAALV